MDKDFQAKIQTIEPVKKSCICYRALHNDFRDPLSTEGNLKVSGRWHKKGRLRALYTSESKDVCLRELRRKINDDHIIRLFNIYSIKIKAGRLLDLSGKQNLDILGISEQELLAGSIEKPEEISLPNQIAECAFNLGYEGLIVKSAAGRGNNIVIFPDNLKSGSSVKSLGCEKD